MKNAIIALLAVSAASSVQAALTINIYESGADVIVVTSGNINLGGLTYSGPGSLINSSMNPGNGSIAIGAPGSFSAYTGLTGAPPSFGTFVVGWGASSGSGTIAGVNTGSVFVPDGYVSLAPLSSTATFGPHTLASLGLSVGSYTWTWGSGGNADSATMNIGSVPEPSSVALLGLAGGFCLLRRRGR